MRSFAQLFRAIHFNLVALQFSLSLPWPVAPHPRIGELRVATRVDPALQRLLPGVPLGMARRDHLDLPLRMFEGRETGSGFDGHEAIVLHRRYTE